MKVSWFDSVQPDVEQALEALPTMELCPHALYCELLDANRGEGRHVALVEDRGDPVAVIGLRRRSRTVREPILNWVVPGAPFPAVPEKRLASLDALGFVTPVAWWRVGEPVPDGPSVEHRETLPAYRMTDLANREQYWRKSNYHRYVRSSRKLCADLRIVRGAPDEAEAIIAGWYAKWFEGPPSTPEVRDRALVSRHLEKAGQQITLAMYDGDTLAAGFTLILHRNELVAGIVHAWDDYRDRRAGVRMWDEAFTLAEDLGLDAFDMGGAQDYKRKWAPEGGVRGAFVVAGARARGLRAVERTLRKLKHTARSLTGREAAA